MQVDMVTPMCSQLTYEGLLDEVYNRKGANERIIQFSINEILIILLYDRGDHETGGMNIGQLK